MKFLKRLLIVLVVLGLVVFFGVPVLLGTSWAKDNIQTAMAEETGREVSIGSVSFSWFDGLKVMDVTVMQRQAELAEEGPLFSLAALNLEVGIRDVLQKKINVQDFSVDEPRIVIVRGADGQFNFGDLLKRPAGETPTEEPDGKTPSGKAPDVSAKLTINDGNILYIDVPLGTRIEMEGIDTKATWINGQLELDMGFKLNGGDVVLKGNLDLSQDPPPFTVKELLVDEATMGTNMAALGLFLPLLGDQPQAASGTIRFSINDLSGKGFTLDQLSKSLTAKGDLKLEGGVVASGAISQLIGLLSGGESTEGLSVKLLGSTFTIEDGRIHTRDMKIEGESFDLRLSGSTDLMGNLDYTVSASRLDELIGKNERLKEYLGKDGTLPLKLTGNLSSPKFDIDLEGAVNTAIDTGIEKGIDRLFGGDDDDEEEEKKKRKKKNRKKKNQEPDAPEKDAPTGE